MNKNTDLAQEMMKILRELQLIRKELQAIRQSVDSLKPQSTVKLVRERYSSHYRVVSSSANDIKAPNLYKDV